MNLHQQFLQLAKHKHEVEYKLLALLPAIYSSGLYKKYAHTIQGYAWRFAQIPESTVLKRLNLEEKIKTNPVLQNLVSEVGVNKVAMLATVVNEDNQEILVEKIRSMSSCGLQELSKEMRGKNDVKIVLNLNSDNSRLWKLVLKMYANMTENEIVSMLLEKELTCVSNTATVNSVKKSLKISTSRYIPAKLKQECVNNFSGKCSYYSCERDAEIIHHTERFSRTQKHSNIQPLCKIHHEFTHNNLVMNETESPGKWKFRLAKTVDPVDLKYISYKLSVP